LPFPEIIKSRAGVGSALFPPPGQAKEELSALVRRIERHFKVLDVRYRPPEGVAFHVSATDEEIETEFDALRKELIASKYVPFITREEGGIFILVGKMPERRFRPIWVNYVLLFATIVTTVIAGSTSWVFYSNQLPDGVGIGDALGAIFTPANLGWGALVFALPLMLILGLHELGHFYMAKRHGVKASLPFFLPLPPVVSPLGTLGAFISVREPIPSKKALMDIGVAGPIVGFVVTIPVLLLGLWLTIAYPQPAPQDLTSAVGIGTSLLFSAIAAPFNIPDNVQLHPTAFAGWVGLLVTALNLLPASQLDGGHVARALFGERSKWLGIGSFIVLIILGLAFLSWWFFAILILLFGLRHPPPLNDLTPLDAKRKTAGWAAIVILVVAFVPVPMQPIDAVVDAEIEPRGGNAGTWTSELDWNGTAEVAFAVRNTGNTAFTVNVTLDTPPLIPWTSGGFRNATNATLPAVSARLAVNQTLNLSLVMGANWDSATKNKTALETIVVVRHQNSEGEMRELARQAVHFKIGSGGRTLAPPDPGPGVEAAPAPSKFRQPLAMVSSLAAPSRTGAA
jgi:Zn-dependent protease